MNSPSFLAKKLEDLCKLSGKAESDFEKASLFAAAEAIVNRFLVDEYRIVLNGYAKEKLITARYHISQATGFADSGGHSVQSLVAMAMGQAHTFVQLMEEYESKIESEL
ncbi:hypothetical protein [Ferrimonas balearica]|uniref:hypothetical protein n=1 Tax=Ferrimonas balearica TaxID=44012 RepID=UPI001C963966|nr:hypothetical protein [Ferrimonas balearica]MBY6223556.1 hypothetical protein [Ferrimonas balearica]